MESVKINLTSKYITGDTIQTNWYMAELKPERVPLYYQLPQIKTERIRSIMRKAKHK